MLHHHNQPSRVFYYVTWSHRQVGIKDIYGSIKNILNTRYAPSMRSINNMTHITFKLDDENEFNAIYDLLLAYVGDIGADEYANVLHHYIHHYS